MRPMRSPDGEARAREEGYAAESNGVTLLIV